MAFKEKKEGHLLQSVDNALRVIEILSENEEMGITELSGKLDLGKSTAFRLVSTLENRDFVIQDPKNGKYRLSMKFVTIGSNILKRKSLINIVHPYIKKLTEQYNESTYISVLDGNNIIVIDKVVSSNAILMDIKIGAVMPAYCTANGKVLLAYIYRDNIDKYIKNTNFIKYTDNTILDGDKFKKELDNIMLNGFAVNNEENEIGLTCFASPIKNSKGEAIASISISGPTSRITEKKENLIASIKETAEQLSKILGGS